MECEASGVVGEVDGDESRGAVAVDIEVDRALVLAVGVEDVGELGCGVAEFGGQERLGDCGGDGGYRESVDGDGARDEAGVALVLVVLG